MKHYTLLLLFSSLVVFGPKRGIRRGLCSLLSLQKNSKNTFMFMRLIIFKEEKQGQ